MADSNLRPQVAERESPTRVHPSERLLELEKFDEIVSNRMISLGSGSTRCDDRKLTTSAST